MDLTAEPSTQFALVEQDNVRLRAKVRSQETQITVLTERNAQLIVALERARSGMTTPMSRPVHEPWPRTAEQEVAQLKANLLDMEARLASAEGRQEPVGVRLGRIDRLIASVGSRL